MAESNQSEKENTQQIPGPIQEKQNDKGHLNKYTAETWTLSGKTKS